jgi:hypothetical protein
MMVAVGWVEARKEKVAGASSPYPLVATGDSAPPTRRSVTAVGGECKENVENSERRPGGALLSPSIDTTDGSIAGRMDDSSY